MRIDGSKICSWVVLTPTPPKQNGGIIIDDNFKCNFVNENGFGFEKFLIEVCFLGCDKWEVIIGLENGLAPNRRQLTI